MSANYNISNKHLPLEYGEIGILVVLLFLSGVCIYPSNAVTNFLIPEVLSSVAYSQTVGGALMVLCLIRASQLLYRKLQGKSSGKTINLTFALTGSLLIFLYGLLFSYIGFYIATIALLFLLAYYFDDKETRSLKGSIIFTVATTIVVSIIFKTFKIYLPSALLF